MNAKKLLETCRKEKREALILAEKIAQLESMTLPKTIPILKDKVQESVEPDPMGDRVATRLELEAELNRQIARILQHDMEAHEIVGKLEEPVHRQILTLYYLTFRNTGEVKSLYRWEDVADEMGYSVRRLYELRAEAMDAVRA